MTIKLTILEILKKNYNPVLYKTDKRIKASAARIINELVFYKVLIVDEKGKVLNKDFSKINELPNFEMLSIIENVIASCHSDVFADSLIATIQSMDYLGKCWYTPKEVALTIEQITLQKHNKNKIRIILDELCKEGKCLRISNNKFERYYRLMFTHNE